MKTLRTLHLYLGCAFAPLMIFFLISGFLQTFNLHERQKSGYTPPAWAEQFGSIHMHQRLEPEKRDARSPNWPMRLVFAATSLGLLATVTLGVSMAWQMRAARKRAMLGLAAGVILPISVLLIQQAMQLEVAGNRRPGAATTQPLR